MIWFSNLNSHLDEVEWSYNHLFFADKKMAENAHPNNRLPNTFPNRMQPDQSTPTKIKLKDVYQSDVHSHHHINWKVVHTIYSGVIILIMMAAVYHFYNDATNKIKSDIALKKITYEICKSEYFENRCEKPKPALRKFCLEKENCMMSNPELEVYRFGSMINLLVEIMNSASEKSTLKTLLAFSVIFLGYIILSIARTLFR